MFSILPICVETIVLPLITFNQDNVKCLIHGSLEGVGGLKTNEAYHSKADALLIPEMGFFFLKIYLRSFLEMLVL